MNVEIFSPVIAGEDLEVKVSVTNTSEKKPIGILVIATAGIYDFSSYRWIEKYCDGFDHDAITRAIPLGQEVVHNIRCNIPSSARVGEADLMIKVAYTDKIGSLSIGDYELIDELSYSFKFEIVERVNMFKKVAEILLVVTLGTILIKFYGGSE